jgi:hypothetical protein
MRRPWYQPDGFSRRLHGAKLYKPIFFLVAQESQGIADHDIIDVEGKAYLRWSRRGTACLEERMIQPL